MTTTFLLDMDNTLLRNDMRLFFPAYFARLEPYLHPYLQGRDLRAMMSRSVQLVIRNDDPSITNYDLFMTHFCTQLGCEVAEIEPLFHAFYTESYPEIEQHIELRPAAVTVVQHLFATGHTVVIATNPLFPRIAIEQRLSWAGVRDFPYAHITTMENCTTCKPNPRYYEEILRRLDKAAADCWMVGDDPLNDIIPARELGLQTWWIDDLANPTELPPACDHRGSLADFLHALQSGSLNAN